MPELPLDNHQRDALVGELDSVSMHSTDEAQIALDYVYAHAAELGGMPLGPGPKARIRFDLDHARQALEAGKGVRNGGRTSQRARSARGR